MKPTPAAPPLSFWALLKAEVHAVFTNQVAVLTMFGGVIFYSFLYPLPYEKQTPLALPIAVVNLDGSALSRELERMVDATPQVRVVKREYTLADAQADFLAQRIRGYLVIPEHFYRDLRLGRSVTLAYAGDATYFLVYGTLVEGLVAAGGTLAAQTKVERLLMAGEPVALAAEQFAVTDINMKPTFNPTIGYMNYVVPAVFVLILQQTLAMAAGLITGSQKGQQGYWVQNGAARVIWVRALVLVTIYYLLSLYYFGFSFLFHDVYPIGTMGDTLTLLLPFLLTTTFIGIWLGLVAPRREWVSAVVLMSSLPLVFSVGFIWPVEAMPSAIVWLSYVFPSTPGIQGFLSLNQMGADWPQVWPKYAILWGQVLFWGSLCHWQFRKQFSASNPKN